MGNGVVSGGGLFDGLSTNGGAALRAAGESRLAPTSARRSWACGGSCLRSTLRQAQGNRGGYGSSRPTSRSSGEPSFQYGKPGMSRADTMDSIAPIWAVTFPMIRLT